MINSGAKRIVLRCVSAVSTLLKKLIADTDVQFSESFEFDGQEMFKHACGVGLEGVASKVRDSRYQSGRSNDWARKICAPRRQTLPICGLALKGSSTASISARQAPQHDWQRQRYNGL
jgi:ATP-dependent DNA ligase